MSENKLMFTATKAADGTQQISVGIVDSLPNPVIVGEWQKMVPSAPREILDMAKQEQKDRHATNAAERAAKKTASIKDAASTIMGQIFGFIIVMTGLLGSFYLLFHGKTVEGLATFITPLAGLASLFIVYRHDLNAPSKSVATPSQPTSKSS